MKQGLLNLVDARTPMHLKAIGIVQNEIKQPSLQNYKEVISDIIVDDSLTEALDGLEGFSHIIVLYWLHRVKSRPIQTKVYPMGSRHRPLVGLFATRSPNRPNPIGKTTVRLLQRQGNRLKVEGLDAIDGTPVIDIKPYIPGYDSTANGKVPPWINK